MAISTDRTPLAVELDSRPFKARIGLVVLATDHVSEPELGQLLSGREIAIYVSRVPYRNPVTTASLQAMAPDLTEATARILPDEELDVLVFGCTAGTVAIGEPNVEHSIGLAKPSVPVITPVSAVTAGLTALGARHISVLTACDEQTSLPIAECFEAKGFEIDRLACVGLTDDREMARIPRNELVRLAKGALHPKSDALFICGSAMRAALIINQVEESIGVPVLSSNYAVAWNVLRILKDSTPATGRLMKRDIPAGFLRGKRETIGLAYDR